MQQLLSISLATLLILASCRTTVREADEAKPVMINYTDWAESVALTHLAALLLEERLDYEVITRLAGVDTVFKEVATGEADIFADAWLPQTHGSYMEEYFDHIEDLGPNYKSARTGLVVPAWSDIKSIDDLKDLYPGPIIGIDTTAGIMQNAARALEEYGLDNELLSLSDAEMSERVEQSLKRREYVVFTGWEPHWLFHRYEMRYLEDPLEVFPGVEKIHTIARKGFKEDHPRATVFFERMILSEKQINELLYEVLLARDPLEGVRAWARKNEFVVNQWVRGLRPEREKIM